VLPLALTLIRRSVPMRHDAGITKAELVRPAEFGRLPVALIFVVSFER